LLVRKERGPASKNRREDRVPNVKIYKRERKQKNSSNNLETNQVG
jgi:hypothetical protein